jgi:hypothetical protein
MPTSLVIRPGFLSEISKFRVGVYSVRVQGAGLMVWGNGQEQEGTSRTTRLQEQRHALIIDY